MAQSAHIVPTQSAHIVPAHFTDMMGHILSNTFESYDRINSMKVLNDFKIQTSDAQTIEIPKSILFLHIPYFRKAFDNHMKELKDNSVKVNFDKEDMDYLIWVGVTGSIFTKQELEVVSVVTPEMWINRFQVLSYFFCEDPAMKKNVEKYLMQSIQSTNDISMQLIQALIHFTFDITTVMDQIISFIWTSYPSVIDEKALSEVLQDKIYGVPLYSAITDQTHARLCSNVPLIKVLLKLQYKISHVLVSTIKRILQNSKVLDKDFISILRENREMDQGLVSNCLVSFFVRLYPYHSAKMIGFYKNLDTLIDAFPDKEKLDLIYKNIFKDSFVRARVTYLQVTGVDKEVRPFQKYGLSIQKISSQTESLIEIINLEEIKTADQFYREYIKRFFPLKHKELSKM